MRRLAGALSGLALVLGLGVGGWASDDERPPQSPPAGGGGVTPIGGQPMIDAQLALARCMREQGIDVPDPEAGGDASEFDPQAQGISPQRMREAEANCQKEMDALKESVPPVSEDQRAAAGDATLRFARCMRDHGQDIADPAAGGPGSETAVEVPADAKSDPAFLAAQKKCESILRETEVESP